jgi:PAS domain S-box-containing protein
MIDDDEDYYILVRDLLAEVPTLSVHLTWHDSYDKGVAALGQDHADVFLVDYRLGAHTGLELLHEAQARQITTPIILLTGQGDQEIAVEAMKAGAADYLVKGQIDPSLLERAIRHALERKQGAEQLALQRTLLEAQGEATIDGILVISPKGEILLHNRRFAEIWHIPPEILQTKSDDAAVKFVLDQLAAPDEFLTKVQHLYAHPDETANDEVLLKDGRTFDRYTAPVRSAAGVLYGRGWFFRDITDRKKADQTRIRLATAIDQSADVIIVTDPQGVIEYVNPAFERTTGYSRTEAIGQTPRLLKSGKQAPEFYTNLWQSLRNGHVWSGQLTNRRKNGSFYETELTITPVNDHNRNIINFVAVSRDVTYQRSIEDQLRQSQKMHAIGRLAGGVAHDFNNMLTVITGYCSLLAQKTGGDDPRRQHIEEIQKAAERAAGLTRQLLAFSRKQLIDPKVINLNDVVGGMEKMLRRLIGENIEFRTALEPAISQVKADVGQIEQVIMNLVVNARDAMPLGGKLIVETAEVVLEKLHHLPAQNDFVPGRYVRICVSDSGVGMTHEVKAHLFEPFFTTKGLGKGTGLGLATSYGIIKQSGGHIIVYSEADHGTTVKVYLPALVGEVVPTAASPGPDDQPANGQGTILVVEDEDALRDLAACVLRDSGYTVLVAANGDEGLQMARANMRKLDLILTDVIMPKMGGKQMIDKLKPLPENTKVLFTSGYTDDALADNGILDPTISFIEKPFSPSRLNHKVREVLEQRGGALTTTKEP